MKWMIYGANGYTGELLVRKCQSLGLKPTLSGRNHTKISVLAKELGLESLVFELEGNPQVKNHLEGFDLVVHCAGPFSVTAEPMMKACIASKTHYFDITGEIAVFELANKLSNEAKAAGILVAPGMAFDVVPTDLLTHVLWKQMPNATQLSLGFKTLMKPSPGTMKTAIESLHAGNLARIDGQLVQNIHSRTINFGDGDQYATSMTWGDLANAYYLTGIKNIRVYFPSVKWLTSIMQLSKFAAPILKSSIIQNFLKNLVVKYVKGPTQDELLNSQTLVWGEISDGQKSLQAVMKLPNPYVFSIESLLVGIQAILNNEIDIPSGFQTPSQWMGIEYITANLGLSYQIQ